jgi:2'-5' RNA ligase
VFNREAGIIKGYDQNKLIEIRNLLRTELCRYKIQNDERYKSESAHITFCRFKYPVNEPNALFSLIRYFQYYELGTIKVKRIDLVEHNWYNSENSRRLIKSFYLM